MHTRSHLILQDLPLLQSFGDRLSVGVSLTTDDEDIRAEFEPHAPSINRRVQLIRKLREAGVEVYVSMSPLLPCNPDRLIAMVAPYATKVWIDTMRWVEVNTHPELLKKYEKFFEQKNYERIVEYIASHFPRHRRSQPALSPTANMEAMTILDARLIDIEALDIERDSHDLQPALHIAAESNPAEKVLNTAGYEAVAALNRCAADATHPDATRMAAQSAPTRTTNPDILSIAAHSDPSNMSTTNADVTSIVANSEESPNQEKRYDETGPEHFVVREDSGYTILINEQYVHKNSVTTQTSVRTTSTAAGANSAVSSVGSTPAPAPNGNSVPVHNSPPKSKAFAQRGANTKSRNDARVTQLKISF